MSLTTENSSQLELQIIEKLNVIHEQFEEIYSIATSNYIRGKITLATEMVRVLKRDFGVW